MRYLLISMNEPSGGPTSLSMHALVLLVDTEDLGPTDANEVGRDDDIG